MERLSTGGTRVLKPHTSPIADTLDVCLDNLTVCVGEQRTLWGAQTRSRHARPNFCTPQVIEVRARKPETLAYGCWQTRPDERIELRLCELFLALQALLAEYRPDAVALEESFVGLDPRGALSIGQVRGALLVACADAGFACVEYPPAQVKQAVCGHGRADKQQVQRMAKTLLGLASTPTPTHAADALAICHALAPPLLRLAS